MVAGPHRGESENWEQLQMFMRAGDIASQLKGSIDFFGDIDTVRKFKLREAKLPKTGDYGSATGQGVYKSVERHGVINPVQLIHSKRGKFMGQGHHRVFSGEDIENRNPGRQVWVPVIHTDRPDFDQFSRYDRVEAAGDYSETRGRGVLFDEDRAFSMAPEEDDARPSGVSDARPSGPPKAGPPNAPRSPRVYKEKR